MIKTRFTNHLDLRIQDRGDGLELNTRTKRRINAKLFERLRVGATTIPGGAVEVKLEGLIIRAVPSIHGGWDVVTAVVDKQ